MLLQFIALTDLYIEFEGEAQRATLCLTLVPDDLSHPVEKPSVTRLQRALIMNELHLKEAKKKTKQKRCIIILSLLQL